MFDNGTLVTTGIADVIAHLSVGRLLSAQACVESFVRDLDRLLRPVASGSCAAELLGFGQITILRLRQSVCAGAEQLRSGSLADAVITLTEAHRQWLRAAGELQIR
jgi:hypothetical protein